MCRRKYLLKLRRSRSVTIWLLGAILVGCIPDISVLAAAFPATGAPRDDLIVAEGRKLSNDVAQAQTLGDLGLALVRLKNAVRLNPRNGELRAYLGIALLKSGDIRIAEQELRNALRDRAPDEIVIPALLDAMVVGGNAEALLEEFPEPLPARQNKIAPDILRERALALQILGRTGEANETMERSLGLRRDPRALTARGKLAAEQGDVALAQRLIGEAAKLAPKDEDVLVSRVALLYQSGDLDRALSAADDFVRRLPLSTIGRVMRIEVLLARKEDALAQAELDALLAQSPDSSFGPYYGGILSARAKNFQDAWHQEQTLQPEFVLSRPGTAMMVAEIAISSGNLASGGAILASLVSRQPNFVPARIRLAEVMMSLKRPDAVIRTLEPIKASDDAQVQAMLGQAYSQLGRYNEAIGILDKAIGVNKEGNNDFLKLQRAQSAYELGDSDRALRDLRDLEAKQPGDWGIAVPLIGSLVEAERFGDALNVISRMPKSTSADTRTIAFYRGRVLSIKGDLKGAEAAFTDALAVDQKFLPALYFRGFVLLARGNPEAAQKDFRQMLALNPANSSAFIALAQIAVHEGQSGESLALVNSAVKAAPRDVAPRLALAALQINRREFEAARTTLDEVLRISPGNPEALTEVGQIQFLVGEPSAAVDTFRGLAATYSSSSAGAYVRLAKALNATKDRLAAIDAARRAVELSPHSAPIRLLLIEYLIAGGRSEQALESARDYVKAYPGPEADTLLASTLAGLGKTNDATTYLNKRLAAKPDRLLVLQLSQLAMTRGETRKASAPLVEWLRKNPDDYEVRHAFGSLLLQTGDTARAREQFEALLKIKPEDPSVLNDLGWCLQNDDPSRAFALVSLAARIAPQSKEIMDTLAWIKFQRHDVEGAIVLLRRAHELDAANEEIGYHYAVALDAVGNRAEAKALLQSVTARNTKFLDKDKARKLLESW